MKSDIIITLLLTAQIISSCGSRTTKSQKLISVNQSTDISFEQECKKILNGDTKQEDSSQGYNIIHRDTLVGFINDDNIKDSVYIEVASKKKYEYNGDISECVEQHEKAIIKVAFGDIKQKLLLVDEEEFNYPYAGYSSLLYTLGKKGVLIRKCRSSRHSDKVYVDAIYEYDSTLNNFFKTKETTQQSEGGNEMDVVVTIDDVQVSIDKTAHKPIGPG